MPSTAFVKQQTEVPAAAFAAEAAGLRWLADAGGVAVCPVLEVRPVRPVLCQEGHDPMPHC